MPQVMLLMDTYIPMAAIFTMGNYGTGSLQFYNGGATDMVITNTGLVGIGTIAPAWTLDVESGFEGISAISQTNYVDGSLGMETFNPTTQSISSTRSV